MKIIHISFTFVYITFCMILMLAIFCTTFHRGPFCKFWSQKALAAPETPKNASISRPGCPSPNSRKEKKSFVLHYTKKDDKLHFKKKKKIALTATFDVISAYHIFHCFICRSSQIPLCRADALTIRLDMYLIVFLVYLINVPVHNCTVLIL
jgi:hypothetical protein